MKANNEFQWTFPNLEYKWFVQGAQRRFQPRLKRISSHKKDSVSGYRQDRPSDSSALSPQTTADKIVVSQAPFISSLRNRFWCLRDKQRCLGHSLPSFLHQTDLDLRHKALSGISWSKQQSVDLSQFVSYTSIVKYDSSHAFWESSAPRRAFWNGLIGDHGMKWSYRNRLSPVIRDHHPSMQGL